MMKDLLPFEMSRTTHLLMTCYIPGELNLQQHSCENLKSHKQISSGFCNNHPLEALKMYFFRVVFSEIGVELFNIHKRTSYSQALPNCINLFISFTHRTLRHITTLHLLWLPLAVALIYKLLCIFTTHSHSDPLPQTTRDTAVTPG